MAIGEIKTQLTLSQVFSQYNLTPDRNHRLCCPWHNDKTPSLQIYPKTNTWTCFSSNCNAGTGDQIDFIMKYEKITKREAILKAKELINPNYSINKTKPLPEISRIAILTKYYQATLSALPRSKKAIEYAKSRNLDYGKLGIGYSGADIGRKWNKSLHESGTQIGVLQKSGEGYRPKIKYCLMFAMKNREGKIVDVYGRSIMDKPNAKHFYLSGKQQGLYPKHPKSETTKLILTESIIDAASLLQSEITNEFSVLALYGTNGFTEEHNKAIKELELLEEVIFFFDGDEAAEKAINKWAPEIKRINDKLKTTHVNTPKGEDVNSLLQGHESEILNHLINERSEVAEQSDLFFSTEKSTESMNERSSQEAKYESASSERTAKADGRPLNKLDTTNTELLTYTTSEIKITILGGIRITGLDRMKVTVKIESRTNPHQLIRHSLDLYCKSSNKSGPLSE